MATTPDLQEPLIAAARAQAWHHTGEALLTLEAARTWLEQYGLLLFTPRANTLGAPAPSFVEATLGTPKETSTLAEGETARSLVARMVGEGSALPLNLLGGPGDLPDFIISAQAFPFVFTLRGDKGWKRAPETSGAVKVTPLGLRVYELLAEKGSLTVAEIVNEVGREITESAVARALSELWQILRVIPVLQQGEGDTRWELITSRFLKAVKAGANAGQPTALSALVSLYLQQSLIATEEEIAAFLSPLTARSRVREVVHGLSAGRQLSEAVVNGKTVLYIPEMLPDFADFAPAAEPAAGAEGGAEVPESPDGPGETIPRERIRTFDGEGSRAAANLRGKPLPRGNASGGFRREQGSRPARPGFTRGSQARSSDERGRSERRPFSPRQERPERTGAPKLFGSRSDSPASSFNRPWEEERRGRAPRSQDAASGERLRERSARPPREDRGTGSDRPNSSFPGREGRPPRRFDDRSPRKPFQRDREIGEAQQGGREQNFPPRSDRPSRNRPAGDKPFRPREDRGSRPDRPFRPREDAGNRSFRPRSAAGDLPFRPREDADRRPSGPREGRGDRPFRPRPEGDRPFQRRSDSGARPFRPRSEGGDSPRRPGAFGSEDRRGPSNSSDQPRGGDRREGGQRSGDRRPGSSRPSGDRPSFGARPPFGSRSGGGRPSFGGKPQGGGGTRGGNFRPSGRPGKNFGDRPDRAPRKPRPEDEA